jgi:hypothetical protein
MSLAASSLFVLSGLLHQRRNAKWKKFAAMTSTRFVKIAPGDLLFEACAVQTISSISGQVTLRTRTRALYQQGDRSDRDAGRMLQSLLLHLPKES